MKTSIACVIAICAVACSRGPAPKRGAATTTSTHNEMQTIDNAQPKPVVFDPPPVVADEGNPTPKSTIGVQTSDAPPPPSPQDEALRASLPFTPAIGLDPVDGSKISIRAATPTAEVKGHIFFFSSEENKRTFLASPETYMKGVFAHL